MNGSGEKKVEEDAKDKINVSKEQGKEKEIKKEHKKKKKREKERLLKEKLKKNTVFDQHAETIVSPILKKIINVAVHISSSGCSGFKLNEYCFNFLKTQINPLVQEEHLDYTKSIINNIPSWSNSLKQDDLWIEIPEPSTINYDRFEGTFINFSKLLPKKKESKNIPVRSEKSKKTCKPRVKFQINSNQNFPDLIGSIRNKSRHNTNSRPSSSNTKISISAIDNEKKNNNNQLNKTEKTDSPKHEKTDKKMSDFLPSSPKKRTRPTYDYPSFDIPNLSKIPSEENLDEINLLRKERKQMILQKELDEKIKQDIFKKIKPKEDVEKNIKTKKIIDSNKLTFDCDGNIIKIKHIKLNTFKKDFILSKFEIKNEIKENLIKRKKNLSKKEKKPELSQKLDKTQIPVIKNINDKKKEVSIISANSKEKIIPSGSNFNLLQPNFGVIIKENDKTKEGSKEFNKYFKKYSLKDYDRMLKEYLPLQNKYLLQNNLTGNVNSISPSNIYIKTEVNEANFNNMNGNNTKSPLNTEYNFNFSEIANNNNINMNPNSLFNTTNINENDNFNSSQKKSFYQQPLYTAYNNNVKLSKISKLHGRYKTFSFENSITVKNGNASVKTELDVLKDLDENNKYKNNNNNINNINIFRKDKRNKRISITENKLLSEFNKNILASADWGNEKNIKDNKQKTGNSFYSLSKHQSKYQALRELGSNILNGIKVKYPRNRKVDLNV